MGIAADFQALGQHIWPPLPSRNRYEKIRILVQLYQAKDLIPSDNNGAADPYVSIYHFGSSTQSSVFPQTLNPCWNEQFILETYMVNNTLPPLIMTLFDKDKSFMGSDSKEFMG